MRQGWIDSQAGDPNHRHEEGGYIVQNTDGSYGIERWPRGAGASIAPPPRASDGTFHGKRVVGEFHTHPNPDIDENGRTWQESPSPGDLTGIQAEHYAGDSYVVGHNNVYRVGNDGSSTRVGPRRDTVGD
jgi:hypothetical protein